MADNDVQTLEALIKHLNQISYLESNIQGSLALEEMLETVLRECISLTGATGGTIMFRDHPSEHLYYYVFQGHDAEVISRSRMKVGDGVVGTVIKEGTPKIVNNISLDPKYIPIRPALNSELVVPLKVGDHTLGAISLDHVQKNAFTETHLEFIQRIAGATGFAVRSFLEREILGRTSHLLYLLTGDISLASAEEIFTMIAEGIGAVGACVLDENGQSQFAYGTLVSPPKFSEENHKNYSVRPLPVFNERGVPYYRISVPRQKGDMVFLADKTYLYMESPLGDQLFADRLLLAISRKDAKIANQNVEKETVAEWAHRKMAEPAGKVYDRAVGEIERALIAEALKKNNGNRLKTALFLGINRNTLRHKMDVYGLE